MVASKAKVAVKVHQCLFGYKDGHRLLASSLSISSDAALLLLVLSDLAPGLNSLDSHGYWTGVPLIADRYYALMRTWPAPEMSRPGCVWTHVLLVGFADIPRFVDLRRLVDEAKRPVLGDSFDSYRLPLSLDVQSDDLADEIRPIRDEDALPVVRSLYQSKFRGRLMGAPGAFDEAIFAAWSQQWPRLRRRFAFRTAVSLSGEANLGVKFDISIAPPVDRRDSKVSSEVDSVAPWESLTVNDFRHKRPTEFRRFLWRYGSDIRRGRDHFRFLANFFILAHGSDIDFADLASALLRGLPAAEDGRVLKEDLISCGHSEYSQLPTSDPLAVLRFFLKNPEAENLLPPPTHALASLEELWRNRIGEVVEVGELAVKRGTSVAAMLLEGIVRLAGPGCFLADTVNQPALRMYVIRKNPDLLDSDYLARVPSAEILNWLRLIPEDAFLEERVVRRLLEVDDSSLASEVLARLPDITMRLIVDVVARSGITSSAWLRALSHRKREFLHGEFISRASTTTALATLAEVMDYDSLEVLDAGPFPWIAGMLNARDDIVGSARQMLLAFLLTIALVRPTRGCEVLLEFSFDPIHEDLWGSSLSDAAYSILVRHLPDVSWWDQWDLCLRLRHAVVSAYIEADLDVQSFRNLTPRSSTFDLLCELARKTRSGRRFLKSPNDEKGRPKRRQKKLL